ncbi:YwmB family TATA-box binding protein [Bacillus carboniphilus]|uniref:YwmB family TATA-box binding protein n=1 Tax=Bacillus carboniphilus TaxID=86663 RepID=A0ABY9JTK7_9BACI|nr:YwmB family TATA-box binding protein [Bacillus carboniphilus]WLR41628.1 YwmB family TATA-box binding protein [Bacillus carboniphilus]
MKRWIIFLMLVTTLTFLIVPKAFRAHSLYKVENEVGKVQEIVKGLEDEHVDISGWSLYAKKRVNIDGEERKELMKQIQDLERPYTWSMIEDEKTSKLVGERINTDIHLKETLQIVTTLTNQSTQSYILYQATQERTSRMENLLKQTVSSHIVDIMGEDVKIFACVNGTLSGKMEGVLQKQANSLLKQFNAKTIEMLNEPNFISVSAYNEEWEQKLQTSNQELNIQIALREKKVGLDEITTVVVGTPIITSEY